MGASRIDRQYQYGYLTPNEAHYVGVAFSDHFTFVVKTKLPDNMHRILSLKSKALFKSRPEIIEDKMFKNSLIEHISKWQEVRLSTNLNVLEWLEKIVKPCIKKLMIERSRQINQEKSGILNMLQIKQAFLVKKVQSGAVDRLAELFFVQSEIVE